MRRLLEIRERQSDGTWKITMNRRLTAAETAERKRKWLEQFKMVDMDHYKNDLTPKETAI